ncbi:hypothetical protein B0J15DRAFT_441386 [Fusarium solani]|uniref:Uncharacterized protein n=1 Tax=Fusarium solani TaxID=169388 RepID=A0A9P9KTG0_FUSSL|nr:uncharacterized protein B0J15DRAFT_441386 [Fusarium solani]KAH7268243.1 hypothetical protein B0J15DRAFT_441386 [Fusarium solani]
MSLTPDQPTTPKIGSTKLLRGFRERSIARPSPTAASPPAFSLPYVGTRAPAAPALHREWAQIPSRPSNPRGFVDVDVPTEIRKIPLVFAVDISGSTRGRCLDQEKAVVNYMTKRLKPTTLVSQSHVLPWDSKSYGSISTTKFRRLEAGAGTDPSVVVENALSRCHLQRARAWFLMTDGYIEEPLVNKFANAIPNHGLHGTASVIILFGYRLRSPFECNVSVGMSVFAVAPHCVFLFHDVTTGQVYVFQAKGSFASLLSKQSRFTSFGPTTRWEDLTQITYDDLSAVKVPKPTSLGRDVVALPGGKEFDMSSIYNNTVSQEETLELLSDYAALDVILLAAKTRGKSSSIELWLETARRTQKMTEVATWEREDIDSQGKKTIVRLLQAVSGNQVSDQQPEDLWHHLATLRSQETANLPQTHDKSAHFETDTLRLKLRLHHVQNWSCFEARVNAHWELGCKLEETLAEVLSTVGFYSCQEPVTPAILTPMSSATLDSPVAREGPRQSPLGHHWPTTEGRRQYTDLLFLPGFKGQRSSKPGIQFALYDTCSICREPNSIQTLLLRASPEEAETEHLPKPGQLAGHKYPFVLGNYPETDVILPITCCDACAFLLLQAGELPNGDRVTIALPLVSLQIQENRNLWEGKLGEVYGHRFRQKIVFLVFLSTLCTTLEDLIDNVGPSDSQSLRRSLEWCCRELSQLPGISARAGLAPVGSPLAGVVNDTMPLQEAIQVAFCQSQPLVQENPLLSYPMDGFLVLVRLAGLMQGIEPRYIERFVWRRLLYHFAEQHAELQKQVGAKEAKATLDDLIHEPPAAMGAAAEAESGASPEGSRALTSRIRRHIISLSSLEGTYLIPSSSDTLEQFGRMGEHFSAIQETTNHHPALAVFLHIMATIADGSSLITDVKDFFDRIQDRIGGLARKHKDLCHAFEPTGSVDEVVAVRLIAAAYELAKDVTP